MQIYNSSLWKSSPTRKHFYPEENCALSDKGFALPSVLFLLVILTTLALSLLSVAYLEKKIALKELHSLQAEFAAQSGIALALDKYSGRPAPTSIQLDRFEFPDGSAADTRIYPWGLILVAESIGASHRQRAQRRSLVAEEASKELDPALVLANPNHSLVMTGTAFIKGDVVVGSAGVSTGSLRDYTTPMKIPVTGRIKKLKNPELPAFSRVMLDSQRDFFDALIGGNIPSYIQRIAVVPGGQVDLSTINDSLQVLLLSGDAILSGSKDHRGPPLYIASTGSVSFADSVRLRGLIAICSAKLIAVLQGSRFENTVLYSQDSIAVMSSLSSSGQLISPAVTLQDGTHLQYPSFVFSIPSKTKIRQQMVIAAHSRVEGTVALLTESFGNPEDHLLTLSDGSQITGAVYSQARLTLDGSVHGSVLTRDLYFYEAPTNYLGWLRKGSIEREKRPRSFMTPLGLSGIPLLGVIQWI